MKSLIDIALYVLLIELCVIGFFAIKILCTYWG